MHCQLLSAVSHVVVKQALSCSCDRKVLSPVLSPVLSLTVQMVSFTMAHLGGMDRGVGRAAGSPLRAEPAKLRGGMGRPMGNPFGASLAEVRGEDCALELSDSSLCSMSLHVSR